MKKFLERYITHDTKKISSELIIYSVFDTKDEMNKLVAITDLKNNTLMNNVIDSFNLNEITNRTNHKNLVKYHDIGIINEGFLSYVYVVFDVDIIHFKSLEKSFVSNKLSLENIAFMLCEILEGLHYAHKTNLIHRNITTDSILYLDNNVKLWDFHRLFLPRSSIQDEQLKHLSYKAPEFFYDKKLCNYLTDIYSLGIVLFRCVNQFDNWLDIIKQVNDLERQVKTSNLINYIGYKSHVTNDIKAIINKACGHTLDNHYSSVLGLKQDLINLFDIKN